MLAIPRSWLTWNFTLSDNSTSVAEFRMSSWREKGSVTISSKSYSVYREGLCSGAFLLESNGKVLARAQKPSALTRRLVIEADGAQFELKPRSALSRTFQLLSGGTVIGTLAPGAFLSRRMNVELPKDLPLPTRAFVVWLALLMWKRDTEAGG